MIGIQEHILQLLQMFSPSKMLPTTLCLDALIGSFKQKTANKPKSKMPVKKLHCTAQIKLLKRWTFRTNSIYFKIFIYIHKKRFEPQASDHLEKLAESLLNNFHREHTLLKLKIKSYCEKLVLKTLTAGVCLFFCCFFLIFDINLTYFHISCLIARQDCVDA